MSADKQPTAVQEKLRMVFSIGAPAFLALAVFDERYTMRRTTVYLMHGIMAALLAMFYFEMPEVLNETIRYRYILLFIMAHLTVSFAPFVVNREMNAFWQYNRILFSRYFMSVFFSTVLFSGLVLAIYAVRELFNADIPAQTPLYLFYSMITVNTWLFLNGVPERVDTLENETAHPAGLKILAGFVMLPLVVVFMAILYAYSFKALFDQHWPPGIIITLIIVLAGTGVVAYLLLWPLKKPEDPKWIRTYLRFFYLTLLPLVGLMSVTTLQKITVEFLTVDLFLLMLTCITLAVICIYFIFSAAKSLKFIPVTLFIAAFAAGFGPFNAFNVSKSAQLGQLISLLKNNDRFKSGKMQRSNTIVKTGDADRIKQLVFELIQFNGVDLFIPYSENEKLNSGFAESRIPYLQTAVLLDSLNIKNESSFMYDKGSFNYEWDKPLSVVGYDYQFELTCGVYNENREEDNFPENSPVHWTYSGKTKNFIFTSGSDSVWVNANRLNRICQEKTMNGRVLNPEAMQVNEYSGRLKITMLIKSINFKHGKDDWADLNAIVLVKLDSLN